MRALLISTYDLGRQPLGLASPAAWLREAGIAVECVDTSRQTLLDEQIRRADLVAFYLPMHTATRLAGPLIDRVRRWNPAARIAAYGLYAPLNAEWLSERGVAHVLGEQAEPALVELARAGASNNSDHSHAHGHADSRPVAAGTSDTGGAGRRPARFLAPDRAGLLAPSQYAALQMPDGSTRVAGNTAATHGCKHLCRHCPVVPVYEGIFRAVPLDVVMDDVRGQVAEGVRHITFGDPDFFNGPTHARRLVETLHREHPSITYDVTIKIEHLLAHSSMLSLLRDTGCLFITSAVESVDDIVLEKLRKGHTRADFARAVRLCRDAGVTLTPTFVAFTPWTTVDGYLDLLNEIDTLGLVAHVAPIQLAIRLLVTARSRLLELGEIRDRVAPFDRESLTWPWRHDDPAVDALQQDVMRIVAASGSRLSRRDVFAAIAERAYEQSGRTAPAPTEGEDDRVPMLTEAWYCCAEPIGFQV